MTKSKALTAAEARIEELERKLAAMTQYAKELRAYVRSLEAAPVEHVAPVHTPHAPIAPITTTYTKADGTTWEKTRIGNRAVIRQVTIN